MTVLPFDASAVAFDGWPGAANIEVTATFSSLELVASQRVGIYAGSDENNYLQISLVKYAPEWYAIETRKVSAGISREQAVYTTSTIPDTVSFSVNRAPHGWASSSYVNGWGVSSTPQGTALSLNYHPEFFAGIVNYHIDLEEIGAVVVEQFGLAISEQQTPWNWPENAKVRAERQDLAGVPLSITPEPSGLALAVVLAVCCVLRRFKR
jgi:hypothetical protein